MNCHRCQQQLSLYLDGDLSDDAGAMVRGHLRGCPACQQVAKQEESVRDGLRSLASVDPPAHTWQHIVERLAQHEVGLAAQPWHVRWWHLGKQQLLTPRVAVASALVAVCSMVLVMKWQRQTDVVLATQPAAPAALLTPSVVTTVEAQKPNVLGRSDLSQPARGAVNGPVMAGDVSADLATAANQRQEALQQTINELQKEIATMRPAWTTAAAQQFDQQFDALNASAASASGRQREAGHRKMVAFLQNAAIGPLAVAP
jgi:anti-sigma factor RsiW